MKYFTLLLALIVPVCCAQSGAQDNPGLTFASLSVAKNVCAAEVNAQVWIFRNKDGWILVDCSQLGPVFAVDTNNPIDATLSLMQSLHDDHEKHSKEKK